MYRLGYRESGALGLFTPLDQGQDPESLIEAGYEIGPVFLDRAQNIKYEDWARGGNQQAVSVQKTRERSTRCSP